MAPESWALLLGAVVTTIGAITTAIKAGSSAYREAVARAAAQIEQKRLADQAKATVEAKNAEITDLRLENQRLWDLVSGEEQ